jgi:hypothetical protein
MYVTPSLSELKAIAAKLNIIPAGDKRSKQSWINAIESAILSESMPELPTHAEQEAIAIAADMVMAVTTSVESITTGSITDKPEPVTAEDESITSDVGTNRGAVTVISALVVMVIALVQAILIVGCEIVRMAILFGSMFGKYKPNLDLWHHLQLRVKSSQLSYS